jgi:hypothetical protein
MNGQQKCDLGKFLCLTSSVSIIKLHIVFPKHMMYRNQSLAKQRLDEKESCNLQIELIK